MSPSRALLFGDCPAALLKIKISSPHRSALKPPLLSMQELCNFSIFGIISAHGFITFHFQLAGQTVYFTETIDFFE
jgi:hypothetical protein